ncbi:MAG: hypothetical protein M0R80_14645 [Proteobacteria bacterium]|jgi:hypothetical protein|nr:hypothetical protein [Pseudomonadota bacterium]
MMKSNAMYLLFIIAFAISCAESHEGEPEDTDTGADTDTDTDSDIDTDCDTDTDSDTDTECECFNDTLPCCDGCNYYGTDHVCEPEAEEVLVCGDEPSCGDIVLAKYRQRYCTGDQGLCAGELGDGLADGGVAEECGDNETCENSADAGTAECQADLVTCPIGFGDRFCQAGGTLNDCGTFAVECTTPTTHDEAVEVADFGVGEVVKLEITTNDRVGLLPRNCLADSHDDSGKAIKLRGLLLAARAA